MGHGAPSPVGGEGTCSLQGPHACIGVIYQLRGLCVRLSQKVTVLKHNDPCLDQTEYIRGGGDATRLASGSVARRVQRAGGVPVSLSL